MPITQEAPSTLLRKDIRARAGRLPRYLYEGSARRYRIGAASEIGLSAARKLASSIRGRADGGQDPQVEKRGKREAARRRRMGETVHSALASCLKDKHTGPIARWKGGLEGGSARAITHHTKRLDKTLGKKLLAEITTRTSSGSSGKRWPRPPRTAVSAPCVCSSDGRSASA